MASSSSSSSSPNSVPQIGAVVIQPDEATSKAEALYNVLQRQALEMPEPDLPEQDLGPALTTMGQLINSSMTGDPLAPIKADLERFVTGNAELLTGVKALFARYQTGRFHDYLTMQHRMDVLFKKAAERTDLTVLEAMALHGIARTEVGAIMASFTAMLKANAADANAETILTKLDYTLQVTTKEASDQFNGTTPQGREIIRKISLSQRRKLVRRSVTSAVSKKPARPKPKPAAPSAHKPTHAPAASVTQSTGPENKI